MLIHLSLIKLRSKKQEAIIHKKKYDRSPMTNLTPWSSHFLSTSFIKVAKPSTHIIKKMEKEVILVKTHLRGYRSNKIIIDKDKNLNKLDIHHNLIKKSNMKFKFKHHGLKISLINMIISLMISILRVPSPLLPFLFHFKQCIISHATRALSIIDLHGINVNCSSKTHLSMTPLSRFTSKNLVHDFA